MATPTPCKVEVKDDWVCSQTRGDHVEYEWTIKNFHDLSEKNGEYISSSVFPANDDKEQWQLRLYPQSYAKEYSKWMSVDLMLGSPKMLGIKIKLRISILQSKQLLLKKTQTLKLEKPIIRIDRFIKRPALPTPDNLNNEVTLRCKIRVLGTYVTSSVNSRYTKQAMSIESEVLSLNDAVGVFCNYEKFSDCTIITGDLKYPAHRNILASRSPVFEAMLDDGEKSANAKKELNIDNMEAEVVEGLLEFIYTDNVGKIEELAHELLSAAEQYHLEGLKVLCEKTICKTLNKENATEILVLADLQRADQLKKYALQYMTDYDSDVIESESFKRTELSPSLAREVITALSRSKKEFRMNEEEIYIFA